jgi:alpha-glucosidase
LLLTASSAYSQGGQYTKEIKVQRGEAWWFARMTALQENGYAALFMPEITPDGPGKEYTYMMLSNRGRYIWSAQPMEVKYTPGEKITITSQDQHVEAKSAGKTLREAYLMCCHTHFPPSGEIPDVNLFTKPIYETAASLGYDQGEEEIVAYAQRLLDEGFPAGIIIIPDGWQSGVGYAFDSSLYPDPAGMVRKLHDMGFKVMLTVSPYTVAGGKSFVHALKNGRILQSEVSNGEKVFISPDGSYKAVYDIRNSEERYRIADGLQAIKRTTGIDGYRFDTSAVENSGLSNQTISEFLKAWMPLGENVSFADFYGGSKRRLAPYVTDIPMNWFSADDIAPLIPISLSGYPYIYPSFGNMVIDLMLDDPDMAAMIAQITMCMPVARLEIAPWSVTDTAAYNRIREAVKFRASIAQYMEELVAESAKTAEPIIRHMEYQFPGRGFADCDDQFMLGSRYLIAPVTDMDKGERIVRLPRGTWRDAEGRKFKGPLVTEVRTGNGLIYFEHLSK